MSFGAEPVSANEMEMEVAMAMNPNDPRSRGSIPPRRKSQALAGVLSCMPGLGQIYVGYYRRGFTNLIVVASVITILTMRETGPLIPLFALFLAFFWLYNIIDAVRIAGLYNDAVLGFGPEDLRRELVLTGARGSLGGGIALVAAGFLFLLHTLFDVPLDWLKDWWPVLPIGFGIYLLWRGIQDRRAKERGPEGRGPEGDR